MCNRTEAGTIVAAQPQEDPQASAWPCFPRCEAWMPGKAEGARRREGPRMAGSSPPAGAAPSPVTWPGGWGPTWSWRNPEQSQLRSAPLILGEPRLWVLEVETWVAEQRRGRRDPGHGPAVGDSGVGHCMDRRVGTWRWAAVGVGEAAPALGSHARFAVQGMRGTHTGDGRLKRPWWTPGAPSPSRQRHPSGPALPHGWVARRQVVDADSGAARAGLGLCAGPAPLRAGCSP